MCLFLLLYDSLFGWIFRLKGKIDKVSSFWMLSFVHNSMCFFIFLSFSIFFPSYHLISFVCWFCCAMFFIWFDSILKFSFVAQWKAVVDRTTSIYINFFPLLPLWLSLFNRLKSRKSLNNALHHKHIHIGNEIYEKKSESSLKSMQKENNRKKYKPISGTHLPLLGNKKKNHIKDGREKIETKTLKCTIPIPISISIRLCYCFRIRSVPFRSVQFGWCTVYMCTVHVMVFGKCVRLPFIFMILSIPPSADICVLPCVCVYGMRQTLFEKKTSTFVPYNLKRFL